MKGKYILYIVIYIVLLFLLYKGDLVSASYDVVSEEGWIDLYVCQEINCSAILVDLVSQSENVSCAFYDIDEPAVVSALRSVDVLLFEDNALDNFPTVSSRGLMHNKFCAFDNELIFTGTWNPTMRGTYKNDNVILIASSPSLNTFYEEAYDHLADRTKKTNPVHVNLSGSMIDGYLCPQHSCEEKVIAEIDSSEESIDILAFSFTSRPIADALLLARDRGVEIRVLFEKTRIASYSQYEYLLSHNISVYKDGNKYVMHEKTFLIDNETLIVGSYNPTANANTRNDENILIIQDENVVEKMNLEFERVFIDVLFK